MSKDELTPIETSLERPSSPMTDTLSPTWAPPKSPLPPYRLAKLANALGVSTPMPAVHAHGFASPSSSAFNQSSLTTPDVRRSPSPSGSNFSSYQPSTSKFLLHVIPPRHLPHESNSTESSRFTPPPSSASGYHTQFRRGTLVPVHSTLQSQLQAIAKEYALPNTAGLVLYLVSNPKSTLSSPDDPPEEPGPRLSEDIWKHLWARVWKVEKEETMSGLLGLGFDMRSQSSPALSPGGSSSGNNNSQLRSFLSRGNDSSAAFPYPSPSSPSPSSTSVSRSNSKSTAPSLSSPVDTPNTSVPDDMSAANTLDLPGLISPGIIPILAKVEFDIDKKKAAWYAPWMRSRTLNHAKRMKSRQRSGDDTSDSGDASDRKAPVMLRLRAQTSSPISLLSSSADSVHPADELNEEYARLQDEQVSEEEQEEESAYDDDDETARVASTGKDPLVDIFGSDADTWADMRELSGPKRISKDPNVVDLALTGGDLAELGEPDEDESHLVEGDDIDEVEQILERMSQDSTSEGRIHRTHVPPPLILHAPNSTGAGLDVPSPNDQSDPGSRASTYIAYLAKSPTTPSPSPDDEEAKVRRSGSGKRVGGVFDDLDLGLEPSVSEDFDDGEIPDDHRRSQYIFKAQLDELERHLNQLSPRALKIDLEDEEDTTVSLKSPFLGLPGKTNADVFPPTPKNSGFDDPSHGPPKQWPAVPYSQLNEEVMPGSGTDPTTPPPPRLAVNGVTTSAPKSFVVRPNGDFSSETKQRRKELEQEFNYPPLSSEHTTSDSPIIPLSPDPFGRYPNPHDPEPSTSRSTSRQSEAFNPDELHVSHQRPPRTDGNSKGSRFSTDSVHQEPVEEKKDKGNNNRTTILSTKGIRKLWRRSNSKSLSNVSVPVVEKAPGSQVIPKTSMDSLNPPPTPGLSSGRSSPTPSRPPRPSEENMDIPDIPEQMAIPLHPGSGRPAPMPIIAAQMQSRSKSALDNLHFDQESPYPTARRSPVPPPAKETYVPGDASRTSVRKSILKWKAAANGSKTSVDLNNDPSANGAVASATRPGSSTVSRPRRPSILNFGGSSRHSQASPTTSIPPSPQIPEQYLKSMNSPNTNTNGAHLRTGSQVTHLTTSSVDTRVDSLISTTRTQSSMTTVRSSSPSQSLLSGKSRTSEEGSDARPSIDESQFEIVSPRMGAQQLSYPYHGLDTPA